MPPSASRSATAYAPDALFLAGLNLLLIFAALVYGFDHHVPAAWRPAAYRLATLPWLAGLAALGGLALRPAVSGRDLAPALGPLLCALQLAVTVFLGLPPLPGLIGALVVLAGVGGLALTRPALGYGAALTIGLALAAASLLYHPIDSRAADMLPVIAWADDTLLTGHMPYGATYPGGAGSVFYYMPLQFLAYLPARVLGLDLRLINVASLLAVIALVEATASAPRARLRAALYPLLLSALAAPMMYNGEIWPYWLASIALALALLSGRVVVAGLLLGVLLCLRQTALVLAAVLAVGMLRRLPWRAYGAAVAAAGVTGATCVLPFLARDPGILRLWFIDGPKTYLPVAAAQGNPGTQISATNILNALGAHGLASPLQILTILAGCALAWPVARGGVWRLLALAGLAETLAMGFNPYLHRYYYINGLLVLAVAVAMRPAAGRPTPEATR